MPRIARKRASRRCWKWSRSIVTKASLGDPSAEEKALAELDLRREELWKLRRGGFPNDKKRELAVERDSRKAKRDWIELNSRLAGDLGFELRKSVEQALKDLKTPRKKK